MEYNMNKLAYITGYMEKTAEKPYKPVMAERVVGALDRPEADKYLEKEAYYLSPEENKNVISFRDKTMDKLLGNFKMSYGKTDKDIPVYIDPYDKQQYAAEKVLKNKQLKAFLMDHSQKSVVDEVVRRIQKKRKFKKLIPQVGVNRLQREMFQHVPIADRHQAFDFDIGEE